MRNFVVAIDGPAGSGKSSISTIVSQRTGFTHVDTGAMFRAVTLYALENNIKLDDENAYGFLDDLKLIFKNDHTYLNGRDVSNEIRTDIITNNVSTVAKIARVREKMIEYERESAKEGLILMDGRDIGTTVFPQAELKIFVTASAEVRAQRRYDELQAKGMPADYADILKNVEERDYIDSHREVSPLRKADDAIELDNSNMTIPEQKAWLMEKYHTAASN